MPLIDPVTMSTTTKKSKAVPSKSPSSLGVGSSHNGDTNGIGEGEIGKDGMLPIPILSNSTAQTVRHTHTVLLASLFLLRFDALVRDPVSTMANSLPVLVALQIAYAVFCLPPAGSNMTKLARRKLKLGEKKKNGADAAGEPNIVITIVVALILSIFSGAGLHVLFVLFGAPFLTHLPHTFLCGVHLAMLGIFPQLYARGVSGPLWRAIAGIQAPLDEPYGSFIGGCVGAWLGAVPIPLDWDREWQKWPVTILCGVYAGYVVGKLVGGTVAYGKRFPN